jgi:hypothetical protein
MVDPVGQGCTLVQHVDYWRRLFEAIDGLLGRSDLFVFFLFLY